MAEIFVDFESETVLTTESDIARLLSGIRAGLRSGIAGGICVVAGAARAAGLVSEYRDS